MHRSHFDPSISGRGNFPATILGSYSLNVLKIEVTTLAFGPGAAAPPHDLATPGAFEGHCRDVNDDGITDLGSHYRIQDTGIDPDDTKACMVGEMLDGTAFEGCDAIRTAAESRCTSSHRVDPRRTA